MDSYDFDVRLTPAARELLRPGEALVLDWHRMAICARGRERPASTLLARRVSAGAKASSA